MNGSQRQPLGPHGERERPKGIVGCQNHEVEGLAANARVGLRAQVGSQAGLPAASVCASQATAHCLNPAWQAQRKGAPKLLRKHIFRTKKERRGEGKEKKTAYLGYFHKMAQDFCPYF